MIRTAVIGDAPAISRLMLRDLEHPDPRFPEELIARFRAHAELDAIMGEFSNPALVAFVSGEVDGFIVGYREGDRITIHYVCGALEVKRQLLKHVLSLGGSFLADTFEFMENYKLFKDWRLIRKDLLAPDLEMLWFEK